MRQFRLWILVIEGETQHHKAQIVQGYVITTVYLYYIYILFFVIKLLISSVYIAIRVMMLTQKG